MKTHRIAALAFVAATAAIAACANESAPKSPTEQANPLGPTTTVETNANTTAAQSKTPANVNATNATGGHANAGARQEQGEVASPPHTNGSQGHGGLPQQVVPAPTNTGDPCGTCR